MANEKYPDDHILDRYLQWLVDIKGYRPISLKKIKLAINRVGSVLGKPILRAVTGSEVEQAIIAAANHRKKSYNGGVFDDGTNTKFRYGLACAMFLRWCYGEGLIIYNPYGKNTFRKPPKREADYLNDGDLARVLNSEKLTITEHAIIHFLLDTALRREELINVRKSDIDFIARTVHIPEAKGNKFRSVPFTEQTLFWIEMYLSCKDTQYKLSNGGAQRSESEYLFSDAVGNPLRYALIGNIFHHISAKVGFRLHAHALRHTAGRLWAEAGINQYLIMIYMGHEDPGMTRQYIHTSVKKLSELQFEVYQSHAVLVQNKLLTRSN